MVDTWITISSTILQNNNQGLLIVGLVKEMHKMSLEHLIVPESKAVLKTTTRVTKKQNLLKTPTLVEGTRKTFGTIGATK